MVIVGQIWHEEVKERVDEQARVQDKKERGYGSLFLALVHVRMNNQWYRMQDRGNGSVFIALEHVSQGEQAVVQNKVQREW